MAHYETLKKPSARLQNKIRLLLEEIDEETKIIEDMKDQIQSLQEQIEMKEDVLSDKVLELEDLQGVF